MKRIQKRAAPPFALFEGWELGSRSFLLAKVSAGLTLLLDALSPQGAEQQSSEPALTAVEMTEVLVASVEMSQSRRDATKMATS